MNPLETFRLIVAYLLPALLSLLFGAPPSAKNPHGRVSFSNTRGAVKFSGSNPRIQRHGGTTSSTEDDDASMMPAAVFVDGSVTGDGPAGIGVWYRDAHPLNYAASLRSPTFTDNNLAELAAVFVALIRHPRRAPIRIHTDSAYVIQTLDPTRAPATSGQRSRTASKSSSAVASTVNKTRRQSINCPHGNSTKETRSPAAVTLIRATRLVLHWRAADTVFHKVRGHAGSAGNERADALAKIGARSSSVCEVLPATDRLVILAGGLSAFLFNGVFVQQGPGGRRTAVFWREMTRFLSGEAGVGRGALGDAPP